MAKLSDLEKAVNQRLKVIFDDLTANNIVSGVTDFCEKAGLDRSNFSKYWREDDQQKEVKTEAVVKLTQAFGINAEWLLTGEGTKYKSGNELKFINIIDEPESELYPHPKSNSSQEARPLFVTIDHTGREVIPLVPVKARAGYLTGYKDPEFIADLQAYSIPGFVNGTFRMFEVKGYSMYQELNKSGLRPGDVVICQYLEDPLQMRDGRVYVVVNHDDILIKRCINRLGSEKKLILKSDNLNGEFPDIVLGPDEIVEVWEFKANITRHIPAPSDTYKTINDLSAQLAILMDDYNKRQKHLH